MRRLLAAIGLGVLVFGGVLALSSPALAAPACATTALPESALRQVADGVAIGGKKLGAGWDRVALGTVTEVRHKSAKYRYRITMQIDSTLGGDLPALYTFFGSTHSTFPFATGQVYAVALSSRVGGPVLPTSELWAEPCDAVIAISDLPAAHEVIASTKPGYQPPPSASPTPQVSESEIAAPVSPTPSTSLPPRLEPAQGANLVVPKRNTLLHLVKLTVIAIAVLGLAIGAFAVAESRWSRRHLA